jgi:hypothetical protein
MHVCQETLIDENKGLIALFLQEALMVKSRLIQAVVPL